MDIEYMKDEIVLPNRTKTVKNDKEHQPAHGEDMFSSGKTNPTALYSTEQQ